MAFNPKTPSATPGEATATADEFHSLMGRITGQSEEMLTTFDSAAMNFSDMISPSISSAGAMNVGSWAEAAMACLVAAEVAEQWSEDLEWYDEKIASLQSQVETVAPYMDDTIINPPEALTAREKFIQSLQTMADEYWVELEEKADWCSERIEGGTSPGNVTHLMEAGRLGWLPYNLLGEDMPTPITAEDGIEAGEDLQEMIESGEIDQERYNEIIFILNILNGRAENAQKNGDRLTEDEIEYLENMYEELENFEDYDGVEGSEGAIALPEIIDQNFDNQHMKDTLLEELGGGLIALSDEKIGGGLSLLPDSIVETIQGRTLSADGLDITTDHVQFGQDLTNLADFLGNAPSELEGGRRFSQDLTLHMGMILEDGLGATAPSFNDFLLNELGEGNMETLLDVSTRNIEANHGILTGQYENGAVDAENIDKVLEEALYGFLLHGESFDPDTAGETDYSKDDFERSGLTAIFDWMSDPEVNRDPETQQLAAESLAGLVDFMVEPDHHAFLRGDTPYGTASDTISRDAADSLSDAFSSHIFSFSSGFGFGEGGALEDTNFVGADQNFGYDPERGTVDILPEDRVRFLEILMQDERAAVNIHSDSALFNTSQVIHSIDGGDITIPARESGNLAGVIDAALTNEAAYRDIEAEEVHKERERMYGFAKDLITGGIGDTSVANFVPGFSAAENLAFDTLKDHLISAPAPNEMFNSEDGSLNPEAVESSMELYLADRMTQEFVENPEENPNPFESTSGELQQEDLDVLREQGLITGGEDGDFSDLEFHADAAREVIDRGNDDLGIDKMQNALTNITMDKPMTWLDNDERVGGGHADKFETNYNNRSETVSGNLSHTKDDLGHRDDQYKENWESR